MRILVVLTDAYGGRGGIALYNRNVLRALCDHPGAREVVALPRTASTQLGPLPTGLRYREDAINSKVRFVRAFAETLLEPSFDLILCSHVNLLPFAKAAAARSRAKLVLFAYGKEAWTPGKPLSNRIVPTVDAIVSIRRHTHERLCAWSGAQLVPHYTLENAFDLERYGSGEKRPDLVAKHGLEGHRVLLTLGRLDEERHGVDEVLEVMPRLLRETPDLMYLIAGSGKHFDRLRRKAHFLHLDSHVVFTGEVPEAEKADYYRLGDVFVMPGSHPTLFDTYPMRFSFLEALACGLPVVATRPVDLAQYEVQLPNIYVDSRNPDAVLEGIRAGLDRAPSEKAPAVLKQFSFDGFRQRLWTIVDQVSTYAALAS